MPRVAGVLCCPPPPTPPPPPPPQLGLIGDADELNGDELWSPIPWSRDDADNIRGFPLDPRELLEKTLPRLLVDGLAIIDIDRKLFELPLEPEAEMSYVRLDVGL